MIYSPRIPPKGGGIQLWGIHWLYCDMGRYTEYTKKSVHLTIEQFSANVTKKQNKQKQTNLNL